jgi:1-acyl-sn-glycerol-3-phosphate acyltransferase
MIVLRSAVFAGALVVVTLPYAFLCLATFPLARMTRYRVISGWSKIMLAIARMACNLDYRVEGRENLPSRPSVILSKHQSAWETLAFQTVFPPQVHVLKKELLWIPFFGWGLAMMSPIAIDRSKGRAALRQLAVLGKERILQGFWVVIFPEGTRVKPGTRKKYQPGGAWLAVQTGAPVVPVAHNAGLYWAKNAFLKHPGTITLRIGPAIATEGRQPAEVNADAERWIEQQQAELCPPPSS